MFTPEGTDFSTLYSRNDTEVSSGVRLHSESQVLCRKMNYFSIFHKELLIELIPISVSHSLLYPETRCELSGATLFSDQPTGHSSY